MFAGPGVDGLAGLRLVAHRGLQTFSRFVRLGGSDGMGWARPFRAIAASRTRTEKRLQELADRSGT